ncbi:MAG: nucleotidyltransferase domain-containing protein [Nitrososphaeria archaeon]|nr:nucleotidyltransferase domain-containing protein [Nitrososphaeria archaeon]
MKVNYYPVSVKDISEKLKESLNSMHDVKIAVLFGSTLTRNLVRDLDVGVLLEREPDLNRLIEIASLLEDCTGIPLDVVPLNKASPKLKLKALSNGVKLVVRDHKLYTLLLKEALAEAMDVDIKLKIVGYRMFPKSGV